MVDARVRQHGASTPVQLYEVSYRVTEDMERDSESVEPLFPLPSFLLFTLPLTSSLLLFYIYIYTSLSILSLFLPSDIILIVCMEGVTQAWTVRHTQISSLPSPPFPLLPTLSLYNANDSCSSRRPAFL